MLLHMKLTIYKESDKGDVSRAERNSSMTEDKVSLLRRDTVIKPVIFIGAGTCGMVAGADKTIIAVENYLKEKKIDADVIETGCNGMCVHEPLMEVQLPGKQRLSFAKVTAQKTEYILDHILNYSVPEENVLGQYPHENLQPWENIINIYDLPFFKYQTRVVLRNCGFIDPYSIEEYEAWGGYLAMKRVLRKYSSDKVCEIIEESGLRGRGGGGYPTGHKWRMALNSPDDERYLICNGDESDPGAFMDRAIFEGDPHRLIEGIIIAAYAIKAKRAFVYIRASYSLAVERLKHAINEAVKAGYLGHDIQGSGFNLNIHIREGAGAFVCGEETALIASIEGKRGTPLPKPPYPVQRGLFGKPTVVNNVETLANVADIIDKGPSWFAATGTATSKGTKVFSISGKVKNTGMVEVAMGTSFRDIIYNIAGGIKNYKKLKAIQIGGPSGSCLPEESLDEIVDYESLKAADAMMGSGGIVVMDEDSCMVDIAKFFADFLQRESCGKCIPCREGSRRMHEILQNITRRPINEAGYETLERFKGVMQLENLAEVIRDTSLCGLGQTAPNSLLSAMKYFREEFEEHIFDRKCRSGVCRDLKIYFIDVDKCSGCIVCARKCPANAIIGSPRMPHFIVEEKCTGCGICFEVCKFGAVLVK